MTYSQWYRQKPSGRLSETDSDSDKYNCDGEVKDGYTREKGSDYIEIDSDLGENTMNWVLNRQVLGVDDDEDIAKVGEFELPVSCIEAAEHIIHYSQYENEEIPDWRHDQRKTVSAFANQEGSNESIVNVSRCDISSNVDQSILEDYDFSAGDIQIGEGILVVNRQDTSIFHAVAVVGKNSKSNRIIVVERNAGKTDGKGYTKDKKWLLNVYESPEDFKSEFSGYIMFKLGNV